MGHNKSGFSSHCNSISVRLLTPELATNHDPRIWGRQNQTNRCQTLVSVIMAFHNIARQNVDDVKINLYVTLQLDGLLVCHVRVHWATCWKTPKTNPLPSLDSGEVFILSSAAPEQFMLGCAN